MKFRKSLVFRLWFSPLLALSIGLILSLASLNLLEKFQILAEDKTYFRLVLCLVLLAAYAFLLQLAFIPLILQPFRAFSRKLTASHERRDILEMNAQDCPECEVVLLKLQELIHWGERQASMASMISQAIREKAQNAERDTMTDLYNKTYLHNFLPEALVRCQVQKEHMSLLMIDLDHFKHYNDTHGHPAGDKVLITTADLLRKSVRDHDICVRFGGEEFIIVLPNSGTDRARHIAERLRSTIENHPFENDDKQPLGSVTASIGCATFPAQAADMEQLIERADQALYESKQTGRNCVTVFGDDPPNYALDDDFDIEQIDGGRTG